MQNSISTKHNPDLDLSNKSAERAPFQLSLITASHGNATKRIIADDNGQPIKDTEYSLGIYAGTVQVPTVNGLAGLQALLNRVQHNQALVHGIPQQSTESGQTLQLVTAKHYRGKPGQIARTKKCFQYPDVKLLMFDVDPDPAAPYEAVSNPQDLIDRLTAVIPELSGMGWLATCSTSSAIRCKSTGAWLKPPAGMHIYILARGDVDRFVKTLKVRLWLAGLGFCKLATPNQKTGVAAVLERAIVDMSVFSPERLDYMAGAQIPSNAPFYQDRPEPLLQPGSVVNLDSIPKPTPAERRDYHQRVATAKRALQPEREQIIAERYRAESPTADTATVKRHVKQRLAQAEAGELEPNHTLYMADGRVLAFGDLTAADDNAPLYDPLEGKNYHRGAYYHWNNGYPYIISLAHGIKTRYRLRITHAVRQARAREFFARTAEDIRQRKPQLIVLRAPEGTGKTKYLLTPALNAADRGVSITHRINLSAENAANADRVDFYQHLQTPDDAAQCDKLSICLPSVSKTLYRFSPAMSQPDIVVIDEFEQALNDLALSSTITNPGALFDTLMDLLKRTLANGGQIYLADANANAETIALLESLLDHDATVYTFTQPRPDVEIVIKDYEAGLDELLQACSESRVAVGADSKNALEQIAAAIPADKRTLLVSQDTKGLPAVAEFLQNPNEGVNKLDCLLYSPTLGTGVSIESDRFEHVFYIATNTVTAEDWLQGLRRVRPAQKITVLLRQVKNNDGLLTDPGEILSRKETRARYEFRDGAPKMISIDALIVVKEAQRNRLKLNPKQSLIKLCRARGFTVTVDNDAPKNKELVKQLNANHQHAKRRAIQDADVLDEFTAESLKRGRRAKTPALAAQLERHQITNAYCLAPDAPIDTAIFERWQNGRGLATLQRADNVFQSDQAVAARSQAEKQKPAASCKTPKLQRDVFIRLLTRLNIDHDTGTGSFTAENALAAWREFHTWRAIAADEIHIPDKAPKYPARWASEQLAKLGLETSSTQTRANGRKRMYSITADSWRFVTDLARQRAQVSQMPVKEYIAQACVTEAAA